MLSFLWNGGNGCALKDSRETVFVRFCWRHSSCHSAFCLLSNGSSPSLLGLAILGLTGLNFGLAIFYYYPFDGAESLDPSADEVLMPPGYTVVVGETHKSP